MATSLAGPSVALLHSQAGPNGLILRLALENPAARQSFTGILLDLACSGAQGPEARLQVLIGAPGHGAANRLRVAAFDLAAEAQMPAPLAPGQRIEIEINLPPPTSGPLSGCRRAALRGAWGSSA